ncbi:unnamed protein product [Closterium sp. NIES-65]|nr:unnamed protein product [Closterium sp. NIES-65]
MSFVETVWDTPRVLRAMCGSSGIGTKTVRVLALRGASVVLTVRSTEAGEVAKASIIKDIEARSSAAAEVSAEVRERVSVMPLDLASLKSVRAADYLRLNRPLHLLINNAGVMICPFMLTADGYENQFGTNHVGECREATTWADHTTSPPPFSPSFFRPPAPPSPLFPSIPFPPSPAHIPHPIASHVVPPLGHFLLTNLLLPKLKETAKQEGAEARIVIVSSAAHQFPYPGGIRFDAINAKEGYDSVKAYGQSKLANILHAWELARRLKEEGAEVTVNALHPGVIDTNLSRHIVPPGTIWHTLGRCSHLMLPCSAPLSGGCKWGLLRRLAGSRGKATALSKDMELAGKLWELSEQMASKE